MRDKILKKIDNKTYFPFDKISMASRREKLDSFHGIYLAEKYCLICRIIVDRR